MSDSIVKERVREIYSQVAVNESSCAGGSPAAPSAADVSMSLGYSLQDVTGVPEGANLGVGCGNPLALAGLRGGETVLDLGSGAGFDCFLAANRVGPNGRVIGVDMTPEMIAKARRGASAGGYANVEFRLGDIEDLPVDDGEVDLVVSNCVISLAPDKAKVFTEAFRVLKSGGRLAVSDTLRTREMPEDVKEAIGPYLSCLPGGVMKDDYVATVKSAGFSEFEIVQETVFPVELVFEEEFTEVMLERGRLTPEHLEEAARSVVSIRFRAIRP
jgi:SAM-dependent methyltransferase